MIKVTVLRAPRSSDYGTNFIAARNEIMKLQTFLASEVTNNNLIHTLTDGISHHNVPLILEESGNQQ